MKSLNFFIFLVLMPFMISCGQIKKAHEIPDYEEILMYHYTFDGKTPKLPHKDSIYITQTIYEVNDNLYTLLDSIVFNVTNCQRYKNAQIEFAFYSGKLDHKPHIKIYNINIHDFNYIVSDKVFYYRNYKFNYNGEVLNDFFKATNESVTFKTYDPEVLAYIDSDPGSSWDYFIINGELLPFASDNCGSIWRNSSLIEEILANDS